MSEIRVIAQKNILKIIFIVTAVGAVTFLRLLLSPLLGDNVPLMIFLLAVIPSALLFGSWFGMLAVFLPTGAASIWIMEHFASATIIRLSVFTVVTVLCALICGYARSNHIKVKRLLKEAKARVEAERQLREQLEIKEADRASILKSLEDSNVQLATSQSVAERASHTKSRFLAQMSHEIRSPMNAILGFTQILIDDALLSGDANIGLLSRIKINGDHLMHIIDDILDLSKFESGRISVEKSEFSPLELVTEVVQSFQSTADQKDLLLELKIQGVLPAEIVSDPSRLKQILYNLIGNALKFTDHGSVVVTVGYGEGLLRAEIADTGVGLSEEQIPKLIQPFEQADSSVNRKFGGAGLGLVLARHLAQALGGDLMLRSEGQGKGSCFSFTISGEPGEHRYPISSRSVPVLGSSIDLADLKVLLAEDSPDGAAIVSRLLTRASARVMVANSGFEVLEQTKLHDFDIILMDVQMPGMDGLEATRILRKSSFTKPIVALTAHSLPEERVRSALAGCDAHLTKPVDKNILLRAIRKHTQAVSIRF